MTAALFILLCVIGTALLFDFTNGFHDTANAVASSIATGALAPKAAVALAAVMNLIGAFLSVAVALTITNSVVKLQNDDGTPKSELMADNGQALLLIILAGLVGAILWNMFTWLLGLPSSSSHALFGGIIGATIAALGGHGVKWVGDGSKIDGVVGKIIMPALLSPLIAGFVATVGTWVVFKIVGGISARRSKSGFRWGQIGGASLVSLAHGTNDAQKTMGVITLALIAYGSWTQTDAIPFWVKVVCAFAIAAGTYLGGWRIIRTLSKGLVEISAPQGMSADGATASVILSSTHLGFALSTTQVASGSILGSGVGRPGAHVRWGVFGRMAMAWATTLPAAGMVGALMWFIGDRLGGYVGAGVIMALLAAGAASMYVQSRHHQVDQHNVDEIWEGGQKVRKAPSRVA
ncbi:MAG TPA: inorganic phosphate transporter [Nocardioides sp.]|uniref:inorganic phosphate transporter n=1 Tax=Nocardioides sp. TaxID=35761 RepID=UPI002CB8B1F3|nr:inorganic phosphate transporter [Nocardioides sp.]HQR26323.1 inorganic phosphate transporter [Nocardioides sp.]